ncbi:MAG: hypothetical protein ACI85Q_001254 [Salibacteraceae bacterium]|jgi:hypothetical protein
MTPKTLIINKELEKVQIFFNRENPFLRIVEIEFRPFLKDEEVKFIQLNIEREVDSTVQIERIVNAPGHSNLIFKFLHK